MVHGNSPVSRISLEQQQQEEQNPRLLCLNMRFAPNDAIENVSVCLLVKPSGKIGAVRTWSQTTLISNKVLLKNQNDQESNSEDFVFKEFHQHLFGEEMQLTTWISPELYFCCPVCLDAYTRLLQRSFSRCTGHCTGQPTFPFRIHKFVASAAGGAVN
uniref:Uncharacterized protein n=1 Tax=Molossus molossus TaxID=27622 RepID=A0A7J8IZC1_MOLMO|nr:hypothetical protein HJG59_010337 [Molossus molossus]